MRRGCEETLRVLRAAKASLLTIVEVFIHDPLYKWRSRRPTRARASRRAPAARACAPRPRRPRLPSPSWASPCCRPARADVAAPARAPGRSPVRASCCLQAGRGRHK